MRVKNDDFSLPVTYKEEKMKIPTYLKANAKWCVWKKVERNGRNTKIPINPLNSFNTLVNNHDTFAVFETAIKVMPTYDELGIHVDRNIIAIDLDNCMEEGKPTNWAEEVISYCKNTCIKISLSGNGLRILLLIGDDYNFDKYTFHIKKGNIEVYASSASLNIHI